MTPRSETYNCDCLQYMRTLPDGYFDLAIADPPYWSPEENTGLIRTSGNTQASLVLGKKFDSELYAELLRVSSAQIIWGANNYGFPFKGFVVWDKTNIPDKFSMSKCEIASVSENLSKVAKVYRSTSSSGGGQNTPNAKTRITLCLAAHHLRKEGRQDLRPDDGEPVQPDRYLQARLRLCGLRTRQEVLRGRLLPVRPRVQRHREIRSDNHETTNTI